VCFQIGAALKDVAPVFMFDSMGKVQQGFIDEGLKVVGGELSEDLHGEGRKTDDFYFVLAAEYVWYKYLMWKVADSGYQDERTLRVRDLAQACRVNGISYVLNTESGYAETEIKITMPNHSYRFWDNGGKVYGGPVDCDLYYPGYWLMESDMNISMKSFVKLLRYFDRVIDSIENDVSELVRRLCLEFKVSRIMNVSLKSFLEPGLEDIKYRYSSCIVDDRLAVRIFLYDVPEKKEFRADGLDLTVCIKVLFGWQELLDNLESYKNMLRNLSSGKSDYTHYSRWAEYAEPWNEYVPEWSEERQY